MKRRLTFLILILFSLTPLLWYWGRGDILINGLDTNFPLDPVIWFVRRLYVWDTSLNAGRDFSSSTAGIFFHLIQLVPFLFGASLRLTQIVSLVFWFGAVVVSSYLFASRLVRGHIARVAFVVIYCYNTYLFNTWENVKVSNLSLVISLPLYLYIFERIRKKEIGFEVLAAWSLVASVLAMGSGINPAYFLTLIVGMALYLVFAFNLKEVKSWMGKVGLVLGVLLVVNLFWILPLVNFLFIGEQIGSLEDLGLTNWIESLSENTSLVNVIRLQGAWDWYAFDRAGFPMYLPYVLNYARRVQFIVFSFSFFTLSLCSLILRERNKKRIYLALGMFGLVGIFLGAGFHEPTGVLYRWMFQKIPFFSFFRSPWYIFTPYVLISFAGLVALFFDYLGKRVKFLMVVLALVFLIGHGFYAYPILTGKIFRPGRNDSYYVSFPDYLWETKERFESERPRGRILLYPDEDLEKFEWGYYGTESILGLFLDVEYINPSFNKVDNGLGRLMNQFYRYMKRGMFEGAVRLTPFMGVEQVFIKNDADSLANSIDGGEFGKATNAKRSFGEWDFYEVSGAEKIFVPSEVVESYASFEAMVAGAEFMNGETVFVMQDDAKTEGLKNDYGWLSAVYKAVSQSDLERLLAKTQVYKAKIDVPGEYRIVVHDVIDPSGINRVRVGEIEIGIEELRVVGGSVVTEEIELDEGEHFVEVDYYENEDVVKVGDYSQYSYLGELGEDALPEDLSTTLVIHSDQDKERKIKIPVESYDPFERYLLSYDFQYHYGFVPIIDVYQYVPEGPVRVQPVYPGMGRDWESRNGAIEFVGVDSSLKIEVRIPGDDQTDKTKSFLRNLSLRKLNDNSVFLMRDEENEFVGPKVTYEKISPVEYRVSVEGANGDYVLAFLETYSKDWIIKPGVEVGNIDHFMINGYANGWYIQDTEGDYTIEIYYRPQAYRKIGLGILVVTIFGIGLVRVVMVKKKRAR